MDRDMNQNPPVPQPTKATLHPDTSPNISEETVLSQEFNFPGELDLPKPSTPVVPMAFPSFEAQHDQLSHHDPPPNSYPQLSTKRHYSPSTGKTPREEKEAVAELLSILVDTMHDLNTRSKVSLLTKFFSEIERDERLENIIVERLMESKVKAISDLCLQLPSSVREKISGSREENSGLGEEDPEPSASNDGGPFPSYDVDSGYSGSMEDFGTSSTSQRSLMETVDELSQELERFKVKAPVVGGIFGKDIQEEGKK